MDIRERIRENFAFLVILSMWRTILFILDIIKNWLQNNKIFFETIGITAFTIMSIIVALSANNISQYQTNLSELEHQPIFNFQRDYFPINSSLEQFKQDLIISNEGTPITNFRAESATFYDIKLYDINNSSKNIIARVPVDGYFLYPFYSYNSTGELVRFESSNKFSNTYLINQILSNFTRYFNNDNSICSIEFKQYIKIYYTDIYNKNREKYYYLDILSNNLISEYSGKKIYQYYYDYLSKSEKIRLDLYQENQSEDYYNNLISLAKICNYIFMKTLE